MRVLAEMPTAALVLWGLVTLLTLFLLGRIIVFRQYQKHPLFVLYLGANLVQTAIGIILYQGYGFSSFIAYVLAWTTQGLVVVARAFAVAEVCYLVLGNYKGIWALSRRILGFCALLVFGLALYFGKHSYQFGVITLEIGLEAFIATGVAGLYLFARYYHIRIEPATALLGLGLGLFSCFKILNDLVFEKFAHAYGFGWNYAGSIAFMGTLLVWIWALRDRVSEKVPAPQLRPSQDYLNLIPQVNRRLADLNDHLARLWNSESPNP
jgi:hypothetical protein